MRGEACARFLSLTSLMQKHPDNSKAEDAVLIRAFKIDDIDLEPTEDEIDYFLAHDYTVVIEDQASSDSPPGTGVLGHTSVQKSYADFVAMNRKNSDNSFSAAAQAEVERKRKELLDRLAARHSSAE